MPKAEMICEFMKNIYPLFPFKTEKSVENNETLPNECE